MRFEETRFSLIFFGLCASGVVAAMQVTPLWVASLPFGLVYAMLVWGAVDEARLGINISLAYLGRRDSPAAPRPFLRCGAKIVLFVLLTAAAWFVVAFPIPGEVTKMEIAMMTGALRGALGAGLVCAASGRIPTQWA